VHESARTLAEAATWAKSQLPLKVNDDFLYEIYILFELLHDLKNQYAIKYIEGRGDTRHHFPRKPALKSGRPRFEVLDKRSQHTLWQICAGTRIADIHGKDRAPDLSFQSPDAGDAPGYTEVIMIWDAKYKTDDRTRITMAELSEFGWWLEVLQLRGTAKPAINLSNLVLLVSNCLITNGDKSTEPDAECLRLDLKEVHSFYPGKMFAVRP